MHCCRLLICCWLALGAGLVHAAVTASEKDVEVKVGEETLTQHRWYLENERVRIGVIDDPGGAVVEFTNLATGTNHVAGQVYTRTVDGKVTKKVGWGWKEFTSDYSYDPVEKQMYYQPYTVAFEDGPDGAKSIVVTGRTAEQQVVRRHTLRPNSPELRVDLTLTNIADRPRRLWLRWHPYSYPSADIYGDSSVVLTPGEGAQMRKIRVGWGWDHWFRSHESYWLAANFLTGEGLFLTFQKDRVPIHFTWTSYGKRNETKGAVTLEPFPEVEWKQPGESVSGSFTYCPFTAADPAAELPLGLVTDEAEQARARAFLARVKPPENMQLFAAHTFARSLQFDWQHRRRDLIGIRDWGWVDCAIVGFPYQHKSIMCRMAGGLFDSAAQVKGFPATYPSIQFVITAVNQDGVLVYRGNESFLPAIGVAGDNRFDAEIAIPMTGMLDGNYTLRVEALDPITRKPFHAHQTDVVVFGERVDLAKREFAEELAGQTADRPFVTALATMDDIPIVDGIARIPIGVEDGSGTRREQFPVRLGVPFPRGAFAPDAPARLLGPDGQAVPAQMRMMNVWPGNSLKWLQVDFPASCPADGFAFYTLEIGAGIAAAPAAAPALAVETEAGLEINTGPLLIRLSKTAPNVPGEVFLDRNGDGTFSPDEQVILASKPGDAWWLGENRQLARLAPSGQPAGMFAPGLSIEQNGPLSATVKLQGWYTDDQGGAPAYGELRLEAHRGQAWFHLYHQVTFTGSPWHDRLASYGLTLRVPPRRYRETFYAIDGQAVRATGASSLYQRSDDRVEMKAAGGNATGRRASGAVALKGLDGSLLLYQPELWQRYPKKLTADPATGEIAIHYWPAEAGVHTFEPYEEYWIPSSSSAEAAGTGASRTAELYVDFSNLVEPAAAEAVYGEPVVACTPPAWVSATEALGTLSPYDPDRYPAVEDYIRETIDFYERNREYYRFYGHWEYGNLHNAYKPELYRWLVVGRYANIGNEENIQRGPWLAWFRSGDRRYYKFATVATRHLMEAQSIRYHNTFPEYIGMSRRHHYTVWIGSGDWGHTMLCPWIEYYHATGYYPAWQMAEQTAASMANTFDGAWRYISNPLIGNIRMYLETGEERYKQVADRIWNDLCAPDRNEWMNASHASRLTRWYSPFNELCRQEWIEWARQGRQVNGKPQLEFQEMDSLGDLWKLTGDEYFAHRTRISFDSFRNTYTGMMHGTHPLYRGMTPTITQYVLGNLREAIVGAAAIAHSQQVFPAAYYGLGAVTEAVIHEPADTDFTVYLSFTGEQGPKIVAPDGQPVSATVTPLMKSAFGKGGSLQLLSVTVKADGQTGLYRLPGLSVGYFGTTLPGAAFRVGNSIRGGSGDPLYVRSSELGGKATRYLMTSAPGTSLELFSLDGTCLCSETYVRPHRDAVGVAHLAELPANATLRLGDRTGITFTSASDLVLYTNPAAMFDLK